MKSFKTNSLDESYDEEKPALKNIYCKIPFILSSKQDKSNL